MDGPLLGEVRRVFGAPFAGAHVQLSRAGHAYTYQERDGKLWLVAEIDPDAEEDGFGWPWQFAPRPTQQQIDAVEHRCTCVKTDEPEMNADWAHDPFCYEHPDMAFVRATLAAIEEHGVRL